MSNIFKLTSIGLVGILLGFTEFLGVLPGVGNLRPNVALQFKDQQSRAITQSQKEFKAIRVGKVGRINSDVTAITAAIAINQIDSYSEITSIRRAAAAELYLYQTNGYIPEPIWTEDTKNLLDYELAFSESADALKVTLRNVSARCGIPVVTPFMVSKALVSWEYPILRMYMAQTKFSAQQLFESAVYRDDVISRFLYPCSHYIAEASQPT